MLPELVLHYREGCHLCEEMEHLLAELLEPGSFVLSRVDIDEDPQLREAYNVRVPVLSLINPANSGHLTLLCEHFLDLQAVRVALASYNSEFLTACNVPADR